jgi:hypothetical protein
MSHPPASVLSASRPGCAPEFAFRFASLGFRSTEGNGVSDGDHSNRRRTRYALSNPEVSYDSDSPSFPTADRNTAGRSRRLQLSDCPSNGQRFARCNHQYPRRASHGRPVWRYRRLGFALLNAVSA